jgi:molecular chaperone DnaJ
MRGAGLPPVGGSRRGDLHVLVNIRVPRKLDETQRSLLRQYAAASGELDATGGDETDRTFFEKFRDKLRGD